VLTLVKYFVIQSISRASAEVKSICTERDKAESSMTAALLFDSRAHPMNIKVCGPMMIRLTVLAVASLLARGASAQSPPRQPPATTPVGVWRGSSVCLVRPSSCNDEIVIYRIARTNTADSLTVDAHKIVRGEEQEMGVLTCRFTSPHGPLTCAIPQGTWQFRVRDDSLVGELRLPDGRKFRDVRAIRSP
jgi:hypothetical protein